MNESLLEQENFFLRYTAATVEDMALWAFCLCVGWNISNNQAVLFHLIMSEVIN